MATMVKSCHVMDMVMPSVFMVRMVMATMVMSWIWLLLW